MKAGNQAIKQYRLFLAVFLCHVLFGFCLSYFEVFSHDTFFGADNSRVFLDLSSIVGAHDRIKVHPLFLLLVQPTVLMLNGVINNMALSIIILEALVSSVATVVLTKLLCDLNISERTRAIMIVLYTFSYSSLIFSGIPETFIFSSAVLICYWYFLLRVSAASQPCSKSTYILFVLFGLLCFGVTLTNYFVYLIGLVYFLRMQKLSVPAAVKNFILLNIVNGILIVLLSLFQNLIWSECPVFFIDLLFDLLGMGYPESHYINLTFNLSKVVIWLQQVVLFPLVSPSLTLDPYFRYVVFSGYHPLPQCIVLILFVLIIFGIIRSVVNAFHQERATKEYLFITLLALIFNLALHFIYGYSESFMYTPHFLFLLIILFAVGIDSLKKGKAVLSVILTVLVLFASVNNCLRAVQAAEIALLDVGKKILWPTVLFGPVVVGFAACLIIFLFQKIRCTNAVPSRDCSERYLHYVLMYYLFSLIPCAFILFNYHGFSGSAEYYRIIYILLLQRFGLA